MDSQESSDEGGRRRVEDNTLRVILYEKGADEVVAPTPEDPGIPPMILYGPNAEIKLRCSGLDAAEAWLRTIYGGKMSVAAFPSKDWAMIGRIPGSNTLSDYSPAGGEIEARVAL
jgi:hypothetical protein